MASSYSSRYSGRSAYTSSSSYTRHSHLLTRSTTPMVRSTYASTLSESASSNSEVTQGRTRTYEAFDVAQWKLQRCQKRLANIDVDSAFNKAQERMRWSAQRYTDRYFKAQEPSTDASPGVRTSGAFDTGGYKSKYLDSRFPSETTAAAATSPRQVTTDKWKASVPDSNSKDKDISPSTTSPVGDKSRGSGRFDGITLPGQAGVNLSKNEEHLRSSPLGNKIYGSSSQSASETEKIDAKLEAEDADEDGDSDYTWTEYTDSEEDEKQEEEHQEVKAQDKCSTVIRVEQDKSEEVEPKIADHSKKAVQSIPSSESVLAKSKAIKLKQDLSWLGKGDHMIMDSMHVTLQKWLDDVTTWSLEPLDSFKGKAAGTTLVGTKPTDPYLRIRDEIFTYSGEKNFFGKPHGKGVVTFENGDQFSGEFRNGDREGKGTLRPKEGDILYLDGVYTKDRLEGRGKIEYRNGDTLYAWFSYGTLHGLAKKFDKDKRLRLLGWYANGKLTGTVWQFLDGGGCLTGEVDLTGNLIGDNVAFLFPDKQTALLGTFVKTQMVMAQTCFIQLVSVRNEICYLKFTQPRGPIYSFDGGTSEVICQDPLLPDPYESQYCYVKTSKIKGAQEGLFAKKNLPKDFIVCFYNGIRLRGDEVSKNKDDWEADAYKIMDLQGPDENGLEGVLDIPPECVSMKNYRASLAHKANHSFNPNGKFTLFHHPRFGKVPAIITTIPIEKDSEITVSYDYALNDAPPWYQELFAKRILDQYKALKTWNF